MEFEVGEMGQTDKVVSARQALRVGFSPVDLTDPYNYLDGLWK